ncbi:M20 metallopeptidase family protein [Acetohalobium arabaticum]|uniref:Amidohydrolase n=1 Tax=Acetohalobium arabaticum (strain ATCC 49924 / DSM 5501 / Z-7288) TaxID=574087 RepID=D9QVS8_ACEAZ|nr:amidohydrolase [Acetohalobium arabaticum]ADL12337.1 amidohydrolase [Acetohalobium arabaticum DSM 5501]
MKNLTDRISDFEEDLITIRREFHKHPETAFNEYETADRIADYLNDWGLEVKTEVGKTGVVGLLRGSNPGKTIAIRVDIDALPIEEETGFEFASQNEGIMHACGHDGHIAVGLGAAKILSEYREELNGNVKFIFQPAEEILSGSEAMLEDGVLSEPEVDAILGLHIWPDIESGSVGIKEGPVMAAVDKFEVEIKGKGGHGAIPNKSIDPIVMGSEAVKSLQKIVSREISPLDSAVITVGTFNAGTAFNVIPDKVELSGTVRTFDSEVRKFISNRIEGIIANVTEGARGEYNLDYEFGIPATVNDARFTAQTKKVAEDILGTDRVVEDIEPSMGGEDFSLYQQEVPGTYLFLGTYNEDKGLTDSIHHPEFSIDEDILSIGVKVFSEIVFDFFKND